MKFNFFEKAKVVGAAALITAAGAHEAGAATTPTKDSHVNKTEIGVENNTNVVDSKTYVFGGKEINENNEKIVNLELAKESIINAGKGPYTSIHMPGFVLVSENAEPALGGAYYNNSLQTLAYKVSNELLGGYYVFNVSLNAEKGSDLLKELNERGVNADFKVTSRLNPTNPLGISYIYNKLRETMDPFQAQNFLEKTNPEISKKNIIASLADNLNSGIGDKEITLKDIEMLKQISQPIDNEKLAENIIN